MIYFDLSNLAKRPLLGRQKQKAPEGAFCFCSGEEQSPCGLCMGDSKLFAYERKAGRIDTASDALSGTQV
ncbi:MAG: hypothetical protein ACK5Q1_15270, partial [Limnobacter sp.]